MLRFILFLSILLATRILSSQSIDAILDSSKIYYDKGKWEEALQLIDIAFEKSVFEDYFHGQVRAHHLRGWVHHQSGDLTKGVNSYLKVINLSERHRDSISTHFEIYARMNLGSILRKEELFDLAEPMVIRGIELCEQIGYDRVRLTLLDNLQRLYRTTGNFNASLQINHQILKTSSRYTSESIKALNGLGIAHQLQDQFILAKYYYEKLYDEALYTNSHKYESYALHNLGDIFYDQKQYSNAIEYYLRAIEVKTNDIEADAEDKHTSHRDIAKAYAKNDQFDKAIFHAKIAEQYLSEITNCLECETKVYAVLGDLMKTQGDQTSQTYYSRKLAIASEKFANEQLEITYESKQPELREVVNGYYADLRSQQEAKASRTLLVSVIIGFVALILVLGAYHFYSRMRVRSTLSAELEKLNWDN